MGHITFGMGGSLYVPDYPMYPDCTFGPGGSVDLGVQDTVTGDTCTHVVLSENLARRFS